MEEKYGNRKSWLRCCMHVGIQKKKKKKAKFLLASLWLKVRERLKNIVQVEKESQYGAQIKLSENTE